MLILPSFLATLASIFRTARRFLVFLTQHPRKPGALNRPMKDKVCSCLVCSSALLVFFSSFPEFEFNSFLFYFSLLLFPFTFPFYFFLFFPGGSCVCFSHRFTVI